MLSITSKSPYAVRALVELHRFGDSDPVPIGELARRGQIPAQFLEQLFATLRRGGLLRSQRGVKGGYSFAKPASQITVLEVVEQLDGPLGADATGVFAEAAQAAREVLGEQSIADVAEAEARLAGTSMYFI
jgi:Rrf2 family cysteine metabolism transcriptional repressor